MRTSMLFTACALLAMGCGPIFAPNVDESSGYLSGDVGEVSGADGAARVGARHDMGGVHVMLTHEDELGREVQAALDIDADVGRNLEIGTHRFGSHSVDGDRGIRMVARSRTEDGPWSYREEASGLTLVVEPTDVECWRRAIVTATFGHQGQTQELSAEFEYANDGSIED